MDQNATIGSIETAVIDVASGTVWVGDPTGLAGPRNNDIAWDRAVQALQAGAEPGVTELAGGLWIGTLWGDGAYRVTLYRNPAGGVVRFCVDFDDRPALLPASLGQNISLLWRGEEDDLDAAASDPEPELPMYCPVCEQYPCGCEAGIGGGES